MGDQRRWCFLRKAEQSKKRMHGLCLSPVHSSMSCVSPGVEGIGCWKVGFREWTQGGLAVKRQPEVTGLRAPHQESSHKTPGTSQKQGIIVEWHRRGRVTTATPFLNHLLQPLQGLGGTPTRVSCPRIIDCQSP